MDSLGFARLPGAEGRIQFTCAKHTGPRRPHRSSALSHTAVPSAASDTHHQPRTGPCGASRRGGRGDHESHDADSCCGPASASAGATSPYERWSARCACEGTVLNESRSPDRRWGMSATSTVWAYAPRVTRTPHSHRATVSSPCPAGFRIGHVRRAVGQRGGLVVRQADSARCHDITVERLELVDCWGGTFQARPNCRGDACCRLQPNPRCNPPPCRIDSPERGCWVARSGSGRLSR